MILLEVEAENFKKLGVDGKFKFRFPRTCLLVKGKNESGKSSLVELIMFCIFGEVPSLTKKGVTLGDFLTHGKVKGVYKLRFEIDGKRYEICRIFRRKADGSVESDKKNTYIKCLDNNEILATNGIKKVNAYVKRLIGLDLKTVLSTNYIGQKELDHLINMDYKNWKDVINNILNLNAFSRANAELVEELNNYLKPKKDEYKRRFSEIENEMLKYAANEREIIMQLKKRKIHMRRLRELSKKREKYDFIDYDRVILKDLENYNTILTQLESRREEKLRFLEELRRSKNKLDLLITKLKNFDDLEEVSNLFKEYRPKVEEYYRTVELKRKIEMTKDAEILYRNKYTELTKKYGYLMNIIDNKSMYIPETDENYRVENVDAEFIENLKRRKDKLGNFIEELESKLNRLMELKKKKERMEQLKQEAEKITDCGIANGLNIELENRIERGKSCILRLNNLHNRLIKIIEAKERSEQVRLKVKELEVLDNDGILLKRAIKESNEYRSFYTELINCRDEIKSVKSAIDGMKKEHKITRYADSREEFEQIRKNAVIVVEAGFSPKNPKVKHLIKYQLPVFGIGSILLFLFSIFYAPFLYAGLIFLGIPAVSVIAVKYDIYVRKKISVITRRILQKYDILEKLKNRERGLNEKCSDKLKRLNSIHSGFSKLLDLYRLSINTRNPVDPSELDGIHRTITEKIDYLKEERRKLKEELIGLKKITDEEPRVWDSINHETEILNGICTEIGNLIKEYPTRYRIFFDNIYYRKVPEVNPTDLKNFESMLEDLGSCLRKSVGLYREEENRLARLNREIKILTIETESIGDIVEETRKINGNIITLITETDRIRNGALLFLDNKIDEIKKGIKRISRLFPERYRVMFDRYGENFDKIGREIEAILESENKEKKELIDKIEELQPKVEKIPQIEETLRTLESESERFMNKIKRRWSEIRGPAGNRMECPNTKEELIKGIGYLRESIKEVEDIVRQLDNSIAEVSGIIKEIKNRIKNCWENIYMLDGQKVDREYSEWKHRLHMIQTEISINKKSKEFLDEINREIMEDNIKFVEYQMSGFISYITGGRYWKLRIVRPERNTKKLEFELYDPIYGIYVPINRLSGGTEDQVMLALRLSFGISLLPRAGGSTPRFLILDECFGSSDTFRRENILNLIKEKMGEYFEQIIVITHEHDVIGNIEYYIELEEGKIIKRNLPTEN